MRRREGRSVTGRQRDCWTRQSWGIGLCCATRRCHTPVTRRASNSATLHLCFAGGNLPRSRQQGAPQCRLSRGAKLPIVHAGAACSPKAGAILLAACRQAAVVLAPCVPPVAVAVSLKPAANVLADSDRGGTGAAVVCCASCTGEQRQPDQGGAPERQQPMQVHGCRLRGGRQADMCRS